MVLRVWLFMFSICSNVALASGSSEMLRAIQSPVAGVLILLSIVVTGIMFAVLKKGSVSRKIIGIACGCSITAGSACLTSVLVRTLM